VESDFAGNLMAAELGGAVVKLAKERLLQEAVATSFLPVYLEKVKET